jgi:HEAT repeat protein
MVALNVVERFRHQNNLHSYRRRLASEVTQDFALGLLPELLSLPIEIIDAAGSPQSLADMLRSNRHVTLSGPSGGGRRLALQQWALQWGTGDQPSGPTPMILALKRLDDGVSSPDQLLSAFMRAATPPIDPKLPRDMSQFFRRDALPPEPNGSAQSRLLIYGWDELPAERRARWRVALLDAAQSQPAVAIALTHPIWEPAWPAFTPLALAPLSPALLARWVEQLVPAEQRGSLLELLATEAAPHPLAERLFELALLAWLAPLGTLPQTRGALYKHMLAQLLNLPIGQLDHAPITYDLQQLAAYGEQPAKISPGLLELDGGGIPHFAHPQAQRYLAARQLVSEQRYALLHQLDDHERAETALLIATMLDDPTPLYSALWNGGKPRTEDVLTLGRCLRERAPINPAWALRVADALARLANQGAPTMRDQALRQLHACLPALNTGLDAIAGAAAKFEQFLLGLFAALPDALAGQCMLRLAYHPQVAEPFAWQLADRVIALAPTLGDHPPPTNQRALARWLYIAVLCDSPPRQLTPTITTAALDAFAASAAGATRTLQAAMALFDNPAHAVSIRRGALALLMDSQEPAALAALERASGDQNPELRLDALQALSHQTPERASITLGRAASDQSATWELRVEAIQQLGRRPVPGAGPTLNQCVADSTLPLYARLQAVAALSQQSDGPALLIQIAGDTSQHPAIRAAATQQLGRTQQTQALDLLIRLIDDPHTPPTIAEACCDSLGALGGWVGGDALLRLLQRTPVDVELIVAALRALGQFGATEMSEPISRLLGTEALELLRHDITAAQLDQPLDTLIDDPTLPQAIALRLATTIKSSVTIEARPTTLAEFLSSEADRLRTAAARALALIGGNTARAALLAALLDDSAGGATADMIAALTDLEGTDSAEALGYLLAAPDVNPLTRWLVVQRLTDHPAGEAVMHRALAQPMIDAFTCGALAEGLGQRGSFAALPALRQIAEDRQQDQQLRAQALLALGLLNEQASETTLIGLIADPHEDPALRGLAAEHLPEQLSSEGRRFLRDMLRNERPPIPIVVGSLRALGHVRDREAIPLMLRYGQDENAEIAQAAITALTDMGDGSVAPMLVRIAHHVGADHTLRLQAAGALLRIGGAGYRSLLRNYLEQGPLPLRLLALEYLIASGTATDDLLVMLASPDWPATLRLRLIDYFAGDLAAAPILARVLDAKSDHIQLRALAAEALGQLQWSAALPALAELAETAGTPAALRISCIAALQQIGGSDAWIVLSRIAEKSDLSPILRDQALRALGKANELQNTYSNPIRIVTWEGGFVGGFPHTPFYNSFRIAI